MAAVGGEDRPLSRTMATKGVGSHGSFSSANHHMSCQAIVEVLQVDEAALLGFGYLVALSAGMLCKAVGVSGFLLQALDGADVNIVSFCNNQETLLYSQLANSLFTLCC